MKNYKTENQHQNVVNVWLLLQATHKPKDNVFISNTINYIF